MSLSLRLRTADDVEVLHYGSRYAVTAGPILRQTKWVGGLFVQYSHPVGTINDFQVERSDGQVSCGFMLNPSENYSDPRSGAAYRNYTSIQPANLQATTFSSGAATDTLITGGGRYLFRHFEKTALTALGVRNGGPAVYNLNDALKISENGLLCNDPDAWLLLATGGTAVRIIGICCSIPEYTGGRLGIDYRDY